MGVNPRYVSDAKTIEAASPTLAEQIKAGIKTITQAKREIKEFNRNEGDDPIKYVVDLNLTRRHLNESQRAMVAANVANMREGRPVETSSIDLVSQEQAAKLLNVSVPSVKRAVQVQTKGTPGLIAAVNSGAVSAGAVIYLQTQARMVKLLHEEALVQETEREEDALGPSLRSSPAVAGFLFVAMFNGVAIS